ncbi:MAG: molybdopterin-dependent oxidoreductase [Acidimicrobiia bacterium]
MTIRRRTETATLDVVGLVEQAGRWALEDLTRLPGRIADLGREVAGFVGEGVPLRSILAASRPLPAADHGTVESDDGHYRASIPLADLEEGGWLIFGLDGESLPRDRGGPLRVVVAEGRTLCWNVKGVAALRLTQGREPDSVPERPGH